PHKRVALATYIASLGERVPRTATSRLRVGAFSVPMESERKRLRILHLTRFLDANRSPLRWKTLWFTSSPAGSCLRSRDETPDRREWLRRPSRDPISTWIRRASSPRADRADESCVRPSGWSPCRTADRRSAAPSSP